MFEGMEELAECMGYHAELRGLLMAMDKPDRGYTIGNIGQNEDPQMIFGVLKTYEGPVTSITLPRRLLFALAQSVNLRLLIEDEIIKCEEEAAKEGVDIHVPKQAK